MVLVDDKKLEAVANFIGEMEVEGNCVCDDFNEALKENRIDVPCDVSICDDVSICEGNCPFYSKENFLNWIKPDRKLSIKEIKRPKAEDFAEHIDNYDDTLIDYPNYAEALERYCNELENLYDDLERDLEYTESDNNELTQKLGEIGDITEKIRDVIDGYGYY